MPAVDVNIFGGVGARLPLKAPRATVASQESEEADTNYPPTLHSLIITRQVLILTLSILNWPIGIRDQREFSIPGILARISFIFSRSTMRFHFVILVPFSKHEILKEKISFSSRTPRFIRQKSRLVSKLEIWKKIFSISSRTTRFRETKISISSQKIHISRCILLIII